MITLTAMPKYEAYKDSGVEWVGNIPCHWSAIRFRNIFSFSKGLNITKENLQDEGIPCVNYGEVHSKFGFEVNPEQHNLKCVDENYLKTNPNSLLKKGDFVFADTSEDLHGSGNFTQLISDVITFAGYHTVIVRLASNQNDKFLAYLFDSVSYRNQIRSKVKGVKVFSITKSILKNTWVWLPEQAEQIAIANFLDEKTAKIDEAIAIKEKQIELLKERKQIIIQQVVTQGLDPTVPMKDSGVEWIGQIPAHWNIRKLRYLGQTQNGISAGAEYFGSGYPFVNYSDVYKNRQLPTVVSGLANSNDYEQNLYSIQDGDVFFTRTSETIEEIGFASICFETIPYAIFSGFLIRFRPIGNLIGKEYSKYFFNAPMLRNYFVKEMNLVTRASLSQELLKNLPVIIPPQQEQLALFEYLEDASEKFDTVINITFSEIEKLREYKTTLINSAVTGKIKVV